MNSIKTFHLFRKTAFAEGISFLVLLFIAMPLKYLADMPVPVKIVGSLHGALFVAYMILALKVMLQYKKSIGWLLKAFIVSLIPFGTFIMDKEWKKEELAAAIKP
jgi:integral membrane protein